MAGKVPGLGALQGRGWQNPLVLRLAQFLLLYSFWLLLSGKLVMEFLVMGALGSALVVVLTSHLFHTSRAEEYVPVPKTYRWLGRTILRFLLYLPWLIIQIVIANLQVTYQILHPRMPVSPRLLRFRTGLSMETPHLLLAHSITLTPGTITIDLDPGEILVHTLLGTPGQILTKGGMQERVAWVFGEELERPSVVLAIDDVNEVTL